MDEIMQLHSEYIRLRDEIMQADSRNYQVLGVMVAGVAAIFAAAFSKGDKPSLVILVVYIVTILGYRMQCANRKRIWRLSTYMRVFLEKKLLYTKWETRIDQQRTRGSKSRHRDFSSFAQTTEWLAVNLINFCTAGFAGWAIIGSVKGVNKRSIVALVLLLVLNICVFIWTITLEMGLKRLGKVEKKFLESWESLEREEVLHSFKLSE